MSGFAQTLRNLGGALRGSRRARAVDDAPERRNIPRVSKHLTVHVAGHTLTSTNVSETGLQLGCPERWLPSLQEKWDRAATALRIELPDGSIMEVQCSVNYVSECDDEFLIGFRFNDPADSQREPWQSYLERLHGPPRSGTA